MGDVLRKANADLEAAALAGARFHRAVVRSDHRAHDGQPETGTGRAAPFRADPARGPLERLEEINHAGRVYDRPAVRHHELRAFSARAEVDPQPSTGDVVPDGVLYEVLHQPVQEHPVAVDDRGPGRSEEHTSELQSRQYL